MEIVLNSIFNLFRTLFNILDNFRFLGISMLDFSIAILLMSAFVPFFVSTMRLEVRNEKNTYHKNLERKKWKEARKNAKKDN